MLIINPDEAMRLPAALYFETALPRRRTSWRRFSRSPPRLDSNSASAVIRPRPTGLGRNAASAAFQTRTDSDLATKKRDPSFYTNEFRFTPKKLFRSLLRISIYSEKIQ